MPPIPEHPAARFSPASDRNKLPIGEALLRLLPPQGIALEIASGSGQHVAHFAALLPGWQWLASDPDASALASIPQWWPQGPTPVQLDVSQSPWPLPASHAQVDAIFCANMLHISGPASAQGLLRGAANHLSAQGQLLIYGPFIVEGQPTAASNLAFDADLRARNPSWGLRQLSAIESLATEQGLHLVQTLPMPANNLLLEFRRSSQSGAQT